MTSATSLSFAFQIHRIRQKAADLIEAQGFWPGPDQIAATEAKDATEGGPCCLVEAVAIAAENEGSSSRAVLGQLRQELGVVGLAAWNDTHSKEEVVAALRGTS